MSKTFLFEREGQIAFFDELGIAADVELTHNTDGVYKGTLFEFKLSIPDINKVLFQAIKYLSHRRLRGEPVPAQILLVALNERKAYLFKSDEFLIDIEKIYAGAASKNNANFDSKSKPEKIDYSHSLARIEEILRNENYTKVHIDVFDVVGWAERYYFLNPKASKSDLFEELRNPTQFSAYIYAWDGKDTDFKYINDLLNARILKKELGAFYTPPLYCRKAVELVREAIKRLPSNHDYIILDRSAGTGNLEEFLTDRPVNNILVGELERFIDKELKKTYLRDKADIISTFYGSENIHNLTVGDLEKHKSNVSLHDYLSDNELAHTIVNTYELKEWIVLNERLGDKVKLIIPPDVTPTDALVNGGDALSEHFIFGSKAGRMFISEDYLAIIDELNSYVEDPRTNIILFENPPYRDEAAKIKNENTSKSFVYEAFKKAGTNEASHRELANLFIWSGWNYYLKKPDDYYVLFSPVKYWKSLGLGERRFIKGYLFNRYFFHAGASAISCILWQNIQESREKLELQALDIDTKGTIEIEDDEILDLGLNIEIKKVHSPMQQVYKDIRKFANDIETDVVCDLSGIESNKRSKRKALFNENIVGHLRITSYNLDPISYSLTRTITYNGLEKSQGFYLRADKFIEKLPLFAAKLYPQKNWYERDVYFTTADGGNRYLNDRNFLKACFIFVCLTQRNHCRSFDGSDSRLYKNQLCFDKGTLATKRLADFDLNTEEIDLLDTFKDVVAKAKRTQKYISKYSYGTYQIDEELNTQYQNDKGDWIYDYPELNTAINVLKSKVAKYYESAIQPKLFEYELLK